MKCIASFAFLAINILTIFYRDYSHDCIKSSTSLSRLSGEARDSNLEDNFLLCSMDIDLSLISAVCKAIILLSYIPTAESLFKLAHCVTIHDETKINISFSQ